jgi:hypothetical protein
MYELVLLEILAQPAVPSRGRHNPRAVKRKMSHFPTKARAAPAPRPVFDYAKHIRLVAPPDPLAEPAPRPARRRARAPAPPAARPAWQEHVAGRPAG